MIARRVVFVCAECVMPLCHFVLLSFCIRDRRTRYISSKNHKKSDVFSLYFSKIYVRNLKRIQRDYIGLF